jgi:surface antigen
MDTKPPLSTYLQSVGPASRKRRGGSGLQSRMRARLQLLPQLGHRTWASLGLWAVLFSIGLYAFEHRTMPPVPASVAAADQPLSSPTASAKVLRTVSKASHLPTGPSGELLPPGTMAPQGTFANSYTRGQCTWYVAGRRRVPGSWGHARTWMPRAQAGGWATGATPAVGAIAWTSAGYYGHVALVEAVNATTKEVLISEMNYTGPYRLTKRWVTAGSFKYIY